METVLIIEDDPTMLRGLKDNFEFKGYKVKKGQVIALVGRTGRATGPHCHFEIRHGQTARNPLFFLPERKGILAKQS